MFLSAICMLISTRFFFFFFSPMIVCAVQMVDSFVQVQNMCSAWSRIVAVVF